MSYMALAQASVDTVSEKYVKTSLKNAEKCDRKLSKWYSEFPFISAIFG